MVSPPFGAAASSPLSAWASCTSPALTTRSPTCSVLPAERCWAAAGADHAKTVLPSSRETAIGHQHVLALPHGLNKDVLTLAFFH